MPRFAVLIYSRTEPLAADAADEDRSAHDRHAQELTDSGAMELAFALTLPADAVTIRRAAVSDGPFVDGGPHVVGFYVLDAPDLDAAVAIAGRNPSARDGSGGVEVRPVEGGFLRA